MLHKLGHAAADKAGIGGLMQRLCRGCTVRLSKKSALWQSLPADFFQMGLQDERQAEPVLHGKHGAEMLPAEALAVGLDADVGLHHGSSHHVLQRIGAKLCLQQAKGTSARLLEGLIDGNGIDIFVHGGYSPV